MNETEPDRDERQIEALQASFHDAFDEGQPDPEIGDAAQALMGIDPDEPEPEPERPEEPKE